MYTIVLYISPPNPHIHNLPIHSLSLLLTYFPVSLYYYTNKHYYISFLSDHNINVMNLPPGFRFYPTDEELVAHFLQRKPSLLPCHPDVIPDLQLFPLDPWDLDGKALVEGKKWYYYSRKTQNRIAENGYWQEWGGGDDEPITNSNTGKTIGVKKYYVFHLGEAPEGVKTSWIMQEFRLSDSASSRSSKRRSGHSNKIDYSKWVICRVYEHNYDEDDEDGTELSCLDEVYLSLDDFDEVSYP